MALAMYAAVTYRRLSQSDDYVLPMNVKAYGFNDGDGDDGDGSYSRRLSVRDSIDRMVSMGSRRTSTGSLTNGPLGLQNLQTAPAPRTLSYYSHERDTQFDEYRARRNSNSLNSSRLDPDRPSSLVYRRGSSLNNGASLASGPSPSPVVAAGPQSRARGASVARAASYTNEHLLVAVPEEQAEVVDADAGAGARHGCGSMSLLRGSHDRLSSDEHLLHDATAVQEVDMTEPESKWRRDG
ncbi:hypothetical protein E4U53_001773 [Claviceps sorghi]|nr:hypothetical protein E4U53_001773 [Claviceps sorghi]